MRAFSDSTLKRQYEITSANISWVLTQDGERLYHTLNWLLHSAHLMAVGGGAASLGAAAITAEATVMVPASRITGWLGFKVVAPTARAVVTAAVLPFTVGAVAVVGGAYVYENYRWRRRSTMFDNPRKWGCPTNGQTLSKQEKGESMSSVGGSISGFLASIGPSSGVLLGSYVRINVGAVSAALLPGAAAVFTPSATILLFLLELQLY